jgi:hypothetical protein
MGNPIRRCLMNECKKSRLLFDNAICGELTHGEKIFLDRHLKNCPKCRAEFNKDRALFSVITKKKDHEPPPGFWEHYTANLHQRMLREGVLTEKKHRKRLNRRLTLPTIPAWAVRGAAAAILLIVGIFIGREFFAPRPQPTPVPVPARQDNENVSGNLTSQQKILLRTGSFLNRSRVILLAIENFDPETENAQIINLPSQKRISKALLKEAIELKQALSQTRQRRLEELVSQVEVILLQISNMDPGSETEILQLTGDGEYICDMLFDLGTYDLHCSKFNIKHKKGNLKKGGQI